MHCSSNAVIAAAIIKRRLSHWANYNGHMVVDAAPAAGVRLDGRRTVWQVVPQLPEDWPRPDEVSRMVAHLLFERGLDTPDLMRAFLQGLPPEHDPFLLTDMTPAVERIRAAAERQERVVVWGDFDVDGLTATAIFLDALRMLGTEPLLHIPSRDDGHGLDRRRVEELADDGVTLLITADCGIADVDAVAAARSRDLDVIVTDHHQPLPDGTLPDALVISPARLDSDYPFQRLAGSGVAYKVAQALLERPERYESLLDLVVLGTVADIVPLRDENRTIVAKGLARLKQTQRMGLIALLKVAGVSRESIDGQSIGFYIGPRINAANRMDDPRVALELITTTDSARAEHLAAELDTHNSRRRDEVERGLSVAIQEAGLPVEVKEAIRAGAHDPIICILGPWGPGISGLLASELTERYCVPAMVASTRDDGLVSVSARSVRDVNVLEILNAAYDANPEAFTSRGGGHAAACGFQTTVAKLPAAFRQLGMAARDRVPITNLISVIRVDAQVTLAQMTLSAMQAVQSLEPYGHDFEAPTFLARGVCLSSRHGMGADGRHMRMTAKAGHAKVSAVIFNHDPELVDVPEDQPVDIVFSLRRNDYGGFFRPQLSIRDWRLSDESSLSDRAA